MHPDWQLDTGITMPGSPARSAQDHHNAAILRRAEKQAHQHHRAIDRQARLEALADVAQQKARAAAQLRRATGGRVQRQQADAEIIRLTPDPELGAARDEQPILGGYPYHEHFADTANPALPAEMQHPKPAVTLYDGMWNVIRSTWSLPGAAPTWTTTIGGQPDPQGSRHIRRAIKRKKKP